ncbi:SH3 domain-containing protein [Desulfovibrio oxyclinae]|uniref:SH3 domain-containing protein n=1 Tax=Desulfovibrio oxyclinae TaxID=63560 RepID=UPI00037EB30C|nr:SH3 domain-containing protein [Desulfovibrio oxyclinae]
MAVGALVGAVAGSFIGKGAGKALAVGIGVLAGGFIGNQIGGYLDEQDRLAVERESTKALSRAKDGETTTWENPDTKAKAEITVEKTETVEREIPIVRHKKVQKPGKLELIGEPYEILTASNVRFGPSMDSDVAEVLPEGDKVLAVGKVNGKNWILINKNRHAIGYIHASLVGKEGTLAKRKAAAKSTAENDDAKAETQTADAQKVMQPAYDLDAMPEDMQSSRTLRKAVNLDTMVASYPDTPETDDYVAEQVEVEAPARTLKMKVSSPKGQEETTVVASKGTDGAWEII